MKYLRIFLTSLQIQLQYRVNLFGWILVGFIPTVTFIWIWLAILGTKESIGGYTRNDFIFYYLFMTLLWYIVGGNFSRAVGDAIKDGEINKSLVKPYNVILEKVLLEQGWKCLAFLFALPPIILSVLYFNVHIPSFDIQRILWLICSLILGGIIFAFLDAIVGMTSFWIAETWSVASLSEISLDVFGGRLAPLTLMPIWLQQVGNFLPFKYIFFIPTNIFMNKSPNPAFDVLTQWCFVMVMFLLYKLIWYFGIKKYEAIGG